MFEQVETWDFTTYALYLCVHYNGSLKKLQGSAFNNGMSAVRCSAPEWGVPSCWSWANNVENKSNQHNSKNNIASHRTWSVTWELVLLKQTIMTRLINVCGLLARSHTELRGCLTLTDAWKGNATSSRYLMEAWRFGSSASNTNDYMVLQVLKRIQFFLNK